MRIINSASRSFKPIFRYSILTALLGLFINPLGYAHDMAQMNQQHQQKENSLDQQHDMQMQHESDSTQDHKSTVDQYSLIAPHLTSLEPISLNQSVHSNHQKEHGGQIYQRTVFENQWQLNKHGQGQLASELESWIGSDENKLYFKGHINKAESEAENYDVSAMYSRNVANFWDIQAGLRYRYDQAYSRGKDQVDAVLGIQGLAPYYFETDAYVYIGRDDQISLSLELERDVLLTQKLILKPYLDMMVILKDGSEFAKKTGFNQTQFGLETRYEINKRFMPFIDIAYVYDRGEKRQIDDAYAQKQADWLYGVGLRLRF